MDPFCYLCLHTVLSVPCSSLLGGDWPLVCGVFLVFLSLSHMMSRARCGI